MDSDKVHPDEEFFPDISSFYDDMDDNTVNVNGSSSVVSYVMLNVMLFILVELMMHFLVLVSSRE
jgi:hypothetical protein